MTFAVHLQRDVRESTAFARAASLRRRIDGLAWRTSLWLADKGIQQRQQEQNQWDQRLQTFDRFTPTAQDFLAALIADQELIARLATDYQQEFDHLRLLSSDLANAAGSVPASIQQLQQANSQSWALLQGSLTNSFNTLQQVAAQHNQLQAAIAATDNEVRQVGQALTAAANQTGQAATAAAQASAQAGGLVQQLHMSQAGMQDELRDTSMALQGSAASFASITTSLDQLRVRLDSLMQSNGQVINALTVLIQQQQPTFQKFEQIAVAFQSDARQIHADFAQLAQLEGTVIQEIRQSVAATQGLSQRIDGLMQVLYRAPAAPSSARPMAGIAESQPAHTAQQPTDVAAQPISPASQERRGGFIDRIFGGGAKS